MSSGGRRTDYYAGALVAVIGAGAAFVSSHYRVGTLTSMGPGFFPVALGVLLAVMGGLHRDGRLRCADADISRTWS